MSKTTGSKTLGFACTCGALGGELTDIAPADYTHVICHCKDCRSAYTHLGLADPEKVGILQTSQDKVRITRGGENLRVFRNSPRGPLRWYATCCDTPLFFTTSTPRLVHVGVNTDRIETPDALDKVRAEGHIPTGKGQQKHKGALTMVTRMATRIAAKNLNGKWRDSPFFDAAGEPSVKPQLLTREQRANALMGVR